MKYKNVEFNMKDSFIQKFKWRQPQWGPLGYFTYKRTYARPITNQKSEEFWQTLQRVVEGCFIIQKHHCDHYHLPWNEREAQKSAQEMYQLMWDFKFLPPGRGLWAMGSDFAFEKGGACLQNCGFVSTTDLVHEFSAPFVWLMDMSLLGVGVGFDTKGAFQDKEVFLREPRSTKDSHIVEDSREGWVAVFKRILDSYDGKDSMPDCFVYNDVRPAGSVIKGFGGIAPGPAPLKELVSRTVTKLNEYVTADKPVDSTLIVDLMNFAGAAVVAGGIRRSSEIALGTMDDEEFNDLKSNNNLKDKMLARWVSNNTHVVHKGNDYTKAARRTAENGEPGYFWIDNARKYGRMKDRPNWRDRRVMGTNPCGEQSLESYELCVAGDTKIQTKTGVYNIDTLVDKPVEVWNGKEWSLVSPFKTSNSSAIFKVTFNDGSYLNCTPDHKFSIRARTRRHFIVKKAKELIAGDILPRFNLSDVGGKYEPNAYEYGLFAGDGYIDNNYSLISMQESAISLISPNGMLYKSQHPKECSEPMQRVRLYLDMDMCYVFRNYSTGLPAVLFSWDKNSILQFTAGLIDTDGSIGNKRAKGEYYRIYGPEQKLRDLQLILRRSNVNRTTLRLFQLKGTKTNKGIRKQDLWYLNIHSKYCKDIPTRYRKVKTTSNGTITNNAYSYGKPISNEYHQKVVSIVPMSKQPTYCFYESKEGMGVFNNVLTYQCNLVESFPIKHDSKEDYFKTLKYAYLYAKTVTLLRTHDSRTNQVMTRNRRIGLSQSGIVENINRLGFREHMVWCNEGYEIVKKWDKVYSEWLGIPESIKKTTVKPSGTVSLLPGVTPGIHYPHSEYYIRRVRVVKTSHLIEAMKDAGYDVVPDIKEPEYTMIVSFPVHEPNFSKRKEDVYMYEQLELAAQMQAYWSDNQVSVTVTVDEEEGRDIATALSMYETRLKSVTFLPLVGHDYEQAPYEEITEEEYNKMIEGLKRPKLNIGLEDEGKIMERGCDTESCEP